MKMEINKKDLSIIDSFKIIFSKRRLGEEAAMEHIENNTRDDKDGPIAMRPEGPNGEPG